MKFLGEEAFDHSAADCTGVLITNLGTPDSCKPADLRRYLKAFLWDPRVVEAPRPIWWLVLHLAVLTTRPRKSAAAYRKVWREDGSPLAVIARQQQRKLQQSLGQQSPEQQNLTQHSITQPPPRPDSFKVELGMRYGNPSIAAALARLKSAGARRLLVLPLYPQYCAATTASAFDAVGAALSRWRWIPAVRLIDHYHDHRGYIDALANSVRDHRSVHGGSEMLLMSFHGIPQAGFEGGDPYPCECRKTARLLAEDLGLGAHEWMVSFQSRFGPKRWLQPYTDQTLAALARDGVRNVQVICPGFSADCLETLGEIEMENREVFMRAGGAKYGYIPCLNDRDDHIRALTALITANTRDWSDRMTSTPPDPQRPGMRLRA